MPDECLEAKTDTVPRLSYRISVMLPISVTTTPSKSPSLLSFFICTAPEPRTTLPYQFSHISPRAFKRNDLHQRHTHRPAPPRQNQRPYKPSRDALASGRSLTRPEIQKDSPGGWAAWKAAKLAKEYEKQGGGYKNQEGSKNKPVKGPPQHKKEEEKKAETKTKTKAAKEDKAEEEEAEQEEEEEEEKAKDTKKPGEFGAEQ